MSGIYGICEPGVQLQPSQLQAMSLARGASTALAPIGGNAALLGADRGLKDCSLSAKHGLLVAADTDLTNYDALHAEHEQANGGGINSAAELVALLYERYGLNFVEKLEGAFALAIWNSTEQRLTLAIDRFGFKTIYWRRDGQRIWFASRLAAIADARPNPDLNPEAVLQFLVHTVVPAPLTIYKGIERLEPGTVLVYERSQTRKTRYWDLNYQEGPDRTVKDWADELRECMRQAVHSHLAGFRREQVGGFLSGGTDSSSVAAFASEVQAPFNTFSIYFENPRFDEAGFSRLAAQHLHTEHHEKCLRSGDASEAISKIIEYYDEPFANSSAIGGYYCAQLARENGVGTLLAGDGGDELFAGNERYATDRKFALYHSVPRILRNRVVKPVAALLPRDGPLSYPARYIRRAEIPNPLRMLSYNFFLAEAGDGVLEPGFLEQAAAHKASAIPQAHFDAAPHANSDLNRLLYLDVKMTLADNDIRKVVGTAEMAGVRVRFPLLDRRLAELSARIPSQLKLKGFEKRYIFKQAMKPILPQRILYKKKHGFGVPLGHWLVHDERMKSLVRVLDEPQARQRGYFQPQFLSRIQELSHTHPGYYGEVLWDVLVLELWHRRHRNVARPESAACGVGVAS